MEVHLRRWRGAQCPKSQLLPLELEVVKVSLGPVSKPKSISWVGFRVSVDPFSLPTTFAFVVLVG